MGGFFGMYAGYYSIKRIKNRNMLPWIVFMIITTFLTYGYFVFGRISLTYADIFVLIGGIVSLILILLSKEEFVNKSKSGV